MGIPGSWLREAIGNRLISVSNQSFQPGDPALLLFDGMKSPFETG